MGHSIQIYKDKSVLANDSDTAIALYTLIDIIKDNSSEYEAIKSLVPQWMSTLGDCFATGCIDMRLETIAENKQATNQLKYALKVSRRDIDSYGGKIDIDTMKKKYKLSRIYYREDYSTEGVFKFINQLEEVIESD